MLRILHTQQGGELRVTTAEHCWRHHQLSRVRSIIKQSYDAKERIMDASLPSHLAHGNLNGDGFGIGASCLTGKDPACCPQLHPPCMSLSAFCRRPQS